MSGRFRRYTVLHGLLAFLLLSAAAAGQSVAARAEELRDVRQFAAAAQLLEAHLARFPDDGEAARLLAQTLLWMRRAGEARRAYQDAMSRHPEDVRIRLDYGRMLVETGDGKAARQVLTPLRDHPAAAADAAALLGTMAYWEGDLVSAERLFADALRSNPSHEAAGRQLADIRAAAAPWVRVSPLFSHDDQPIDRAAATIAGGWSTSALTSFEVRVEPARYSAGDNAHTMWAADGRFRHFAPASRIDSELGIGFLQRGGSSQESADWTGVAMLGVRLPRHVTVRARGERFAYLRTVASLDKAVVVNTIGGEVRWEDSRGWLGEAALRRTGYPDSNSALTIYGWLLAPFVNTENVRLQGGYAFGSDDAESSRFTLVAPPVSVFTTMGRYDPYYTPSHVVKHSATVGLTVGAAQRLTLKVSASRALHAREDAPGFVTATATPELVFFRREFHPWTARVSVEIPASESVSFTLIGDAGREAFYRWANGEIQITYRFLADRRRREHLVP